MATLSSGATWQNVAHETGYASSSGPVGLVTLYTGPEQHCANRGALNEPIGGVLHTKPGILDGHSEKAAEDEDRSKVGLPAQVGMAAAGVVVAGIDVGRWRGVSSYSFIYDLGLVFAGLHRRRTFNE